MIRSSNRPGLYWNCPKFITPRYTAGEVEVTLAPLRERIAELEGELRQHSQSPQVRDASVVPNPPLP